VGFVLAPLGEALNSVQDVSVVYPHGHIAGFWQLISGQVDKVIVAIQTGELGPALWQGDYDNDAAFRQFVQNRVTKRWEDKDTRIAQIRAEIEG
jgi:hypothetical protein